MVAFQTTVILESKLYVLAGMFTSLNLSAPHVSSSVNGSNSSCFIGCYKI